MSLCDALGSGAAAAAAALSALESLDMSGCVGLDDRGVGALCDLAALTRLRLRGCMRVSTGGLQLIANSLPRLADVALSSDSDRGAPRQLHLLLLGCWGLLGARQLMLSERLAVWTCAWEATGHGGPAGCHCNGIASPYSC